MHYRRNGYRRNGYQLPDPASIDLAAFIWSGSQLVKMLERVVSMYFYVSL